ncbi:MAG: sigma-70 family RNA polymerase sigma factor [Pseudomonadota bacterium]
MAVRRQTDLNTPAAQDATAPGASNEELISRALILKDAQAFDQLVLRNQSRVRSWLRHLAKGDAALADDLAQETFLRAWRKLGTFKASGSFEAWLLTIARNEFLQHVRKSGREANRIDELRQTVETDREADANVASSGVEQHDMGRVLRMLKPEERDLMILVYGIGLTHSEASDVSGMPVGTVKSHIRRGAARVREQASHEEQCGDKQLRSQ